MRPSVRISFIACIVAAAALLSPLPASASSSCGASAGYQICLSVPDGPLAGDVPVSVSITGSTSGLGGIQFNWGTTATTTTPLLRDVEAPFGFVWRTDRYVDATQFLNARVVPASGSLGAPVSMQATIANGNVGSVPPNPSDWAQLFQPRPVAGDPVLAAVGDGGDGTARSFSVADSVLASNASTLLYLGDIYETGTAAEWDANFGRAAWEPSGGAGWGRLTTFTRPAVGNHEAANEAVWRDYWHGRPLWTSFADGGAFFLALDSECQRVGCGPTSAQYAFVQQALAANTLPCIVAYWHRPALSSVSNETTMNPIWSLLARSGGDLVLNGHIHDMEATAPLDGNLAAGQPGSHMVELVSGAGGHNLASTAATDPRETWQALKVPGAAYLTLNGGATGTADSISWSFRDRSGAQITSPMGTGAGNMACSDAPDTTPPSVPGTPTGTSGVPGEIDLTWAASTDDRAATMTYRVYRDGSATPAGQVTSASTTTVSFADTGLDPGSTHAYQVDASDGTNASAPGPSSPPITVAQPGAPVFVDRFGNGLSAWTKTAGLSSDATTGGQSPPSVRGQPSNGPGYAYKTLPATFGSLCLAEAVNMRTVGSSDVVLARLQTATDGPVGRVFVRSSGLLGVRSDVSGAQQMTTMTLPLGTWSTVELCGTVGTAGTWDLYLNGSRILSGWTANNGTTPIGEVSIGDSAAKTWSGNFDDVVAGSMPSSVLPPDTTPPSVPGQPVGTSTSPGRIDLSWAASTDDRATTITYRVYEDGSATAVGQVVTSSTGPVTFTDTGLAGGGAHAYQVDATDGTNASQLSSSSDPVTVALGNQPVFSDDFTNGFVAWQQGAGLTLDQTSGGASPPSAKASVSTARAYAVMPLAQTMPTACVQEAVNLQSVGTAGAVLFRLRTAADGPVGRVYVTSGMMVSVRNDVTGAVAHATSAIPRSTWLTVKGCVATGTSGTFDVWVNGNQVVAAWPGNFGTDPVGRLEIGDKNTDTWSGNLDDVVLTASAQQRTRA